jgi:hypothetical protein
MISEKTERSSDVPNLTIFNIQINQRRVGIKKHDIVDKSGIIYYTEAKERSPMG